MKDRRHICLAFLFIGLVLRLSSSAQGSFYARNYSPPLNAPVFNAEGNPLFGSNYVAMLFGGPTTDSLIPATGYESLQAMEPVPFTGVLLGGQVGYFDGGAVKIRNVMGGALTWLQVVAWDRRLGNSYDSVVALGIGGYGASALFQANAGCPECTLPTLPAPLVGLQSFSISSVVPEPGIGFLLLLGLPFLAAHWFMRRGGSE